jgi:hypothetical protein
MRWMGDLDQRADQRYEASKERESIALMQLIGKSCAGDCGDSGTTEYGDDVDLATPVISTNR